jgi:hypothetical protein
LMCTPDSSHATAAECRSVWTPMPSTPGAGHQLEATQVGDQRAQRGLQSGGVVGGDHRVAVAGQN